MNYLSLIFSIFLIFFVLVCRTIAPFVCKLCHSWLCATITPSSVSIIEISLVVFFFLYFVFLILTLLLSNRISQSLSDSQTYKVNAIYKMSSTATQRTLKGKLCKCGFVASSGRNVIYWDLPLSEKVIKKKYRIRKSEYKSRNHI